MQWKFLQIILLTEELHSPNNLGLLRMFWKTETFKSREKKWYPDPWSGRDILQQKVLQYLRD